MSEFTQLRALARQKRDKAIQAARDEYRETMREIRRVCVAVGLKRPSRARPVGNRALRRSNGKPFRDLTIVEAAERILLEGKPLTLIELAVELQQRGYPTGDKPRRLVQAIRAAFTYHKGRFTRDEAGRWTVRDGR